MLLVTWGAVSTLVLTCCSCHLTAFLLLARTSRDADLPSIKLPNTPSPQPRSALPASHSKSYLWMVGSLSGIHARSSFTLAATKAFGVRAFCEFVDGCYGSRVRPLPVRAFRADARGGLCEKGAACLVTVHVGCLPLLLSQNQGRAQPCP